MTSEPPYSDRGGSGGGESDGERVPHGIAPVRAFVVLVIFVVATIALVAVGTRHSVSGDAATPPTTTPTTVATGGHTTAPTTTTTTVPHSSVTVLVANATQTNGLAAHYTTVLGAQGWAMQTAVDAATTEAASTVYFAAGEQAAAASIAGTLGLKPTAVAPLTTAVPVTGASADDVVVVVGTDLVPTST
jgi:LytR cell envelope-related transcriptional attenuator